VVKILTTPNNESYSFSVGPMALPFDREPWDM